MIRDDSSIENLLDTETESAIPPDRSGVKYDIGVAFCQRVDTRPGAKRWGRRTFSFAFPASHLVEVFPMITRSPRIQWFLLLALIIGLLAAPKADAHGGHGGHSAGRAPRAPHFSAGPRAYKAPRMSNAAAPARANNTGIQARMNNTAARGNRTNTQTRAYTHTLANNANSRANRASTTGTVNPATTGALNTTRATSNGLSPNTYTYGYGNGARRYHAYGYGNGYRNRRYGGGYGYGRSQGNNRAVISRLRSVHASLARINHDYQGHRVRAMHSISMAIRQLSHRSMSYGGMGVSSGMNNGRAMGMRQGGGGVNNAGARGRQPMTQAQSDARMSQNLRVLQGINMQISSQGNNTSGHGRASGHIQRAIHELNVALSIR